MDSLGWIIVASVFVLAIVTAYVYSSFSVEYEAKHSLDAGEPDPAEDVGIVLIPKKLILVMWGMVAGVVALECYYPGYAVSVLLLCGFALIAASVRIHSKSKPTSREDVGLAFLNGLARLSYVSLIAGVYVVADSTALGQAWMITFLLTGATICYLLVGSRPSLRDCARLLLSVLLLGYLACASPFRFINFVMDRENVVELVEAYDDATARYYSEDLQQAQLIRALVRDGGSDADITKPLAARVSFLRHLGRSGTDEEVLMHALEEQGYFHERDYEEMGALQFAWLLEEHRNWGFGMGTDEALERLQERGLSAAGRIELADQVAGDATTASGFIFLDRLVGWIEMLERLGYSEKGEASRGRVLDFLAAKDLYRLSYQFDGVRVMERFGVPDGYDLVGLHDSLELQARGPLFGTVDLDEALAYMALASIERFPEWGPTAKSRSTWLYRLWRYRDALVAFFVAIASVVITLRTPKGTDETLPAPMQVT